MAKTSTIELCPTCGAVELTVWVEKTTTGLRPGTRAWVDPADQGHLTACVPPEPDPIVEGDPVGDLPAETP